MARDPRDSAAGARMRTGRSSASLDPNRSTVRRSSGRRNTMARPALPAPDQSPRNSRVSRPASVVPKGPSWLTRTLTGLLASSERVSSSLQERARRLLDLQVPSPSTWVLRIVGLLVIVVAGFGVAHFVQRHLTTAPAFAIDTIDIKGLSRVQRDELLQAASLAPGQNIFASRCRRGWRTIPGSCPRRYSASCPPSSASWCASATRWR